MGKYKDAIEEHDAAMRELNALLGKAYDLVCDGKVTTAEFVGTLECTKHIVLTNNDRVYAVSQVSDIIDTLFGCDDEEGE